MKVTFSELILLLRKTGMTDVEIAERTGSHKSNICRVAAGQMPRYRLGAALVALAQERVGEVHRMARELADLSVSFSANVE